MLAATEPELRHRLQRLGEDGLEARADPVHELQLEQPRQPARVALQRARGGRVDRRTRPTRRRNDCEGDEVVDHVVAKEVELGAAGARHGVTRRYATATTMGTATMMGTAHFRQAVAPQEGQGLGDLSVLDRCQARRRERRRHPPAACDRDPAQ